MSGGSGRSRADRRRGAKAALPSLFVYCLGVVGCTTVTVPSSDPNPPSLSWSFGNPGTRSSYAASGGGSPGQPATVLALIGGGNIYNMGVQANNPGGVKSMSLTGKGQAICGGNSGPYTQSHPFNFTVPSQSYTFPIQANNQVNTQENIVYVFNWDGPQGTGQYVLPAGPTNPAYTACGQNVPLLGSVTYTATASNYSNVASQSAVRVSTCIPSTGCMPNF
jgi:hypothetical protein